LPEESFPPLDARLELPAAWRFVLLRPLGHATVSGTEEDARIAALPTASSNVTQVLIDEAREHLLPAAATADFTAFSASVYRFNRSAGELFAAAQGGPYNGEIVTALIARCRQLGTTGVGQSSWGPTVFSACEDQAAAEWLVEKLRAEYSAEQLELTITPPDNRGVNIVQTNERPR
jgi:predicted sugar kinase